MRSLRIFRSVALIASAALLVLLAVSPPSWAYEKEIAEQAAAIAARLNQTPHTTVAVVDFTDLQTKVTELGRFLAEELSSALAGTIGRKFAVIDRGHLRDILLEHKLGTTGIIDPKTASQLGKVAGVRNLVGGTITQFQDSIRLSVKVFDSETADILYSSAFNIPKTAVLATLIGNDLQEPSPGSSSGTQSPVKLSCTTKRESFAAQTPGFRTALGGITASTIRRSRSSSVIEAAATSGASTAASRRRRSVSRPRSGETARLPLGAYTFST